MTKSWSDVRAKASDLYAEGKSLEQVRDHLLREKGFQASYVLSICHVAFR